MTAIATTSGGLAWSLGYADGEQAPPAEVPAAIARITRVVELPATVDMESGYGDTLAAAGASVRAIIAAGAVGINLEDGLPGHRGLRPCTEAAARIEAARRAATAASVPIVINARADTCVQHPGDSDASCFDDTVQRAQAYLAAGADCVYPIAQFRPMEATMNIRIDYRKAAPDAFKAMLDLETGVRRSGLEHALLELVKMRVSQINGCAYCLDMHSKDARAAGETEQRLYLLPAWRETPFYSQRERAALAWAEAVTQVSMNELSDTLYAEVRAHFDEKAMVELTLAIIAINGWNRLAIAFRADVGGHAARSVG